MLLRVSLVCLTLISLAGCRTPEAVTNNSAPTSSAPPDASPALRSAEVVKFEPAGVQLTVPQGWSVRKEGGGLVLMPPDNSLTVKVYAPADRSMEAAMTEVDRTVQNKQTLHIDMKSTAIADGMKVQNFNGTGQVEGKQVQWILSLIGTADNKPLALLTSGELKGSEKAHQLGQLVTSLRKSK